MEVKEAFGVSWKGDRQAFVCEVGDDGAGLGFRLEAAFESGEGDVVGGQKF